MGPSRNYSIYLSVVYEISLCETVNDVNILNPHKLTASAGIKLVVRLERCISVRPQTCCVIDGLNVVPEFYGNLGDL